MTYLLPSLLGFLVLQGQSQDKRLILDSIGSEQLPVGFAMGGGTFSPEGNILIWSSREPILLYQTDHGTYDTLEFGSNLPPLAVGFVSADVIDILASSDGRILRATLDAVPPGVTERFLPLMSDSARVIEGTRTKTGWCIALRGPDGQVSVYQYNDAAMPIHLVSLKSSDYSLKFPDTLAQLNVHLSPSGGGCAVSMWWYPFDSFIYDSIGNLNRVIEPDLPSLGEVPGASRPAVVALPLLSIDSTFIQTFSDLRSDKRVFLVMGLRPSHGRSLIIESPIGLVAVHQVSRRIMALRVSESAELVTYRWSWGEDGKP